MVCWFIHQAPAPVPAPHLLNMFIPMYSLCGMGDPWEYFGVQATATRQRAYITQGSRFGIGDVTFLAVAYGRMEYVVDTCKRLSKHTIHLSSGEKLENVRV